MAKSILPKDVAVLYLRMSTSRQEKSIPAQRAELKKLAEKKGYTVLREYVDEGISGDKTEKRSGFLKMRADAEKLRDFSIILAWDQDRFSRNDPLEVGFWLKPIRDAGIILETPAGQVDWNTLGGRLIYLISQEMKHDFLQSLSRNVTRGLLASAKTNQKGTGGASPQGLRGDPERAAIVQRIFNDYLIPGGSLRSVADGLNRDKILSPKGKRWSVTTVRFVLINRKYTGDYVRFRYRAGRYNAVKDGEIVPRSKSDCFEVVEPMIIPDHHEAIIDRKTFEAVQQKLLKQKRNTAHRTGRQYLFSGILYCTDCDRKMAGTPYNRGDGTQNAYRCHSYLDGGASACYRNQIREVVILDPVFRLLEREYLSEEAIERIRVRISQQQEAEREVAPVDAARLRKRIEHLNQQIDTGYDKILDAPKEHANILYSKLDKLKQERGQLEAQLTKTELPSKAIQDKKSQEIDEAIAALRNIRLTIRKADPLETRELIRKIVPRIDLKFSHKRNGKRMMSTLTGGVIHVRPEPAISSIMLTNPNF